MPNLNKPTVEILLCLTVCPFKSKLCTVEPWSSDFRGAISKPLVPSLEPIIQTQVGLCHPNNKLLHDFHWRLRPQTLPKNRPLASLLYVGFPNYTNPIIRKAEDRLFRAVWGHKIKISSQRETCLYRNGLRRPMRSNFSKIVRRA